MKRDLQTIYDILSELSQYFRGQKQLRAVAESHGDMPVQGGSPYSPRPSSSRAHSAAAKHFDKAMVELDSEEHMPEGVDLDVWQRLVDVRRQKVDSEQQVRIVYDVDIHDYKL